MNGETLLLPGPVTMHHEVQAVLARPAGPHYGEPWAELQRGQLAGKVFRVAHMGRAAEPEVVDAYLASTRQYLEQTGLS